MNRELSRAQIEVYHRDGFLHLPGFFDQVEIAPLQRSLEDDPTIGGRLYYVHDGADETRGDDENSYRMDYIVWHRDGDDWLGTCTRLERVVEGATALIGEPVYHYHSKLAKKPNIDSGTLMWHQDYGGWYQDGCLMPDMLTFVLAVTDATAHSGCLRFLRGSHKMGRVDRIRDDYAYANIHPRREAAMKEQFEEVAAEMRQGDGLFFHGNLVHCSGPNHADYDRWLLEFSYNAISNPPVFENQKHHAVKPMKVASDNALHAGNFESIFERTSILDMSDPTAEGASIVYREDFPDLS